MHIIRLIDVLRQQIKCNIFNQYIADSASLMFYIETVRIYTREHRMCITGEQRRMYTIRNILLLGLHRYTIYQRATTVGNEVLKRLEPKLPRSRQYCEQYGNYGMIMETKNE